MTPEELAEQNRKALFFDGRSPSEITEQDRIRKLKAKREAEQQQEETGEWWRRYYAARQPQYGPRAWWNNPTWGNDYNIVEALQAKGMTFVQASVAAKQDWEEHRPWSYREMVWEARGFVWGLLCPLLLALWVWNWASMGPTDGFIPLMELFPIVAVGVFPYFCMSPRQSAKCDAEDEARAAKGHPWREMLGVGMMFSSDLNMVKDGAILVGIEEVRKQRRFQQQSLDLQQEQVDLQRSQSKVTMKQYSEEEIAQISRQMLREMEQDLAQRARR